ncbi:ATP-binding cassette domain-containing protein [Streptomyces caniscabiei]|uniref:ATP-binding cassette domain-containing protein n=1 Tax=Streptomyces caniscabiei TaxID=2746961 RepID=A0A927LAZ5_9ACTN|nr:ATP-binding cassette domain-containing protein [Streptomyces caniscabiei]MBD9725723.1 ATP-binding cassette domain-containing protein [Streptomyces caniscabiei]MDX3510013.1 ATP-binding cassette domain-containing protein [Streptomyces caniscabiei]MDX3720776.1 ATP-binding cassette domain-containing protein [Streptomyces caniscabiei]WEO27635.1 ATP-binding cassette domain-containing protein [Streptomyces caniscabiei]
MAETGETDTGRGTARGVAVGAEGFGLAGPRGWVFRGVGFDAEAGSLVAIAGPSGSGRTSLLLALTGRMKPTEGRATVGSLPLPKRMAAVRRISALAHVPGVTDLDPALTVGEHLRERALLQRRFDGTLRGLLRPRAERAAETKERIEAAATAAGLDREALPKGSRTAVRDLDRMEALRLSVTLALVGRPRLLGVDDADLKLSDAERAEMWALLRSLTESGTTVVAVCSEAPEGAVTVSTAPDEAARARDDVREPPKPATATDTDTDVDADTDTDAETDSDTGTDTDTETDDKETADALAEARRA